MSNSNGISITHSNGNFWCYNCDSRIAGIAIKLNTFQAIHLCPQCFKWLQVGMANYNGLEVAQNDA